MVDRSSRIVVAGAGSIGCYVGGCLALAGRPVKLLLRPALADAIARNGLRISDLEGADRTLPASSIGIETDGRRALSGAAAVVVTVKGGDTAEMALLIARHAPADAVVISLQNGAGNIETLRLSLGESRRIVPGMVPFNVVQARDGGPVPHFHRATSGTLLIGSGVPGLHEMLDVPGFALAERGDMAGVLWGKLLINLNNALNALAGIPLAEELADRRWRRLLAAQVNEALGVLKAARIRPAAIEGVPARAVPFILRLPDALFRRVARRMLAVDPQARSSMWEDLVRGRATEIDYLQGAILALARAAGVEAPLTQRISSLVKRAEAARAGSPGLTPDAITGGTAI
ncbi:MAG TPA: 2-dehydropantoate 2-reductase [Hyphomicrobiaceae bacterium]|jgi:2-dehydropantoate 2-reductase|nr:2-dehydropantoate 2-reductase [Hyphomicrobiaceae bacterium]